MVIPSQIAPTLFRGIYLYTITLLYLLAAASTVDVFMTKWTTVVDHPQYSLKKTLERTEPKPYAFRVLMPILVNKTFELLPTRVLSAFSHRARLASHRYLYEYNTAPPLWTDDLNTKYGLSGVWFFLLFFATLLLFRHLATHISSSRLLCDGSPLIFALVLPLSFRAVGGFIYDFSELFLLSLYLWLLLANHRWWALALLPVAVLNKETALLWPLLLLFPLMFSVDWKKTMRDTACHLMLASVVVLGVRWFLRDVEGTNSEFHFVGNLQFWFDSRTYLMGLTTSLPLIPFPKPQHILFFPFLVIVLFAYWKEKPLWLRHATTIGFILVLPLVLLFCYRDEFRNFSLLFPLVFLSGVHTLHRFFFQPESTGEPESTTEREHGRTYTGSGA